MTTVDTTKATAQGGKAVIEAEPVKRPWGAYLAYLASR